MARKDSERISNQCKAKALGMPYGTASSKLRKNLMFSMAYALDRTVCFRCGKEIEKIEELSIDHKTPWLKSNDPGKNFFDLNNIAFSHLSCNVAAGEKPPKKYRDEYERKRASTKRQRNDPAKYARVLRQKRERYHGVRNHPKLPFL